MSSNMSPIKPLAIVVLTLHFVTSLVEASCPGGCPNGGTCVGIDMCNCVDGYFSPRCEQCRSIPNCVAVTCNDFYIAICSICDGEYGIHGSAYKKTSDQRRCVKQCSWRTDSSACFPGTCVDAACTCSDGFSGADCRTMDESQAPVLSEYKAILVKGTTKLEVGGSTGAGTATSYTNLQGFTDLIIDWKSSYQPGGLPDPSLIPFVDEIKLGVVSARVTAQVHLAGGGIHMIGDGECSEAGTQDQPVTTLLVCEYNFTLDYSVWTPANEDVLMYSVETTSGGIMKLFDRDNSNDSIIRYYQGVTASASANFSFDFIGPYHCVNATAGCQTTMLDTGSDVTSKADITVTWQGWTDNISGIGEYDLQVRQLSGAHGDQMTELFDVPAVYAGPAESGLNVTLPHAGVYSFVLFVLDGAANAQLCRRFVFLDDDPNDVAVHAADPLRVLSADAETDYEWLTQLTGSGGGSGATTPVTLDWQGHFSNYFHFNQGLLKPIANYTSSPIESDFDQYFGLRGRAAILNTLGITEFRVFYDIDHSDGRDSVNASEDDSGNWTSVVATDTQATFDLTLVDGDSVRFWVEARDIAGHFARDSVLVHADSTPPVIDMGDSLMAIRSSGELSGLSVVFRAYDVHSGLRSVEWRIFENETGVEVELARNSLPVVRIDKETEDCDPVSCLCTPAGDCYAVTFGFNPALHIGSPESAYYIALTVTNRARIVTNSTMKVVVDMSPPEAGAVHDGIPGSNEVDYQENNGLSAHWLGFHDRESSIAFYNFIFHRLCWEDKTMLRSIIGNMTKTKSTHASWTAPSPGRYYVTVIAFNSAGETSDPVCSDGVVIDPSPPDLSQIDITGARMWPGLAVDSGGDVWIVDGHRRRMTLVNASANCSSKATEVDDISVYPKMKSTISRKTLASIRDDVDCETLRGIEERFFLPVHKHLTVSWSGKDDQSGIYDFEVGLSSDQSDLTPDLVAFRSTSGHRHHVMYHPQLSQGSVFHLVIKATNGAQLSQTKVIGPIIVDTTPPVFIGDISVRVEVDFLVAEWGNRSFVEDEDTGLAYQVGIGSSEGGTETLPYQDETEYQTGPCWSRTHCTAFPLDGLDWYLHGDHEYYVSVRAVNGAGLASVGTSSVYRHVVQLPSRGVVLDVAPPGEEVVINLGTAKDVDVQSSIGSISARWYGFDHPHLEITYQLAVGSDMAGSSDVSGGFLDVGSATFYRLDGLNLIALTTYFVTVRANSDAGSVNVTSDGVKVIPEGLVLEGCSVQDGLGCYQDNVESSNQTTPAPDQQPCQDDADYQSSTSDLSARWVIPESLLPFVTNVLWGIEQEIGSVSDDGTTVSEWMTFLEERDLGMALWHTQTGAGLADGGHYRSKVQFCHSGVCFKPVVSDGVRVLSRPPEVGSIRVTGVSEAPNGTEMIATAFQPFVHDYVGLSGDADQAELMDFYEWRIDGGSREATGMTQWMRIRDLALTENEAQFTATYDGQLDRELCPQLSVRGHNRAGLWSIATADIFDCDDATSVTPRLVIDADHEVTLEQNAAWHEPDKQYTSSTTFLAAVWPTLRHPAYTWAAIEELGTAEFGDLDKGLDNPCDHPMARACGETDKEFINVEDVSLVHGSRYRICIHANAAILRHETWNQTLPSLSSCSDGIMVDTTPPIPGSVWIGPDQHQTFQRTTSELVIHWASFYDSEERGATAQHSGIKYYEYAVGTFLGGSDVKEFTRVGRIESVIVHGLRLEHGHSYYATVRATDFAGLSAQASSDLLIIDALPPAVNASHALDIGGSLIKSTTSITASWKNVFSDSQSGIAYYEWAVGSLPGHADIMLFTRVDSETAVTDPSRPLSLQEGHTYFVSVKAIDNVQLVTLRSFGAYLVDASPPVPGHVFDGEPSLAPPGHRDRDFQSDPSLLGAFWEGFLDPHSTILGYSWKTGTCKGCGDVVTVQSVGMDTSVLAVNLNLVPGLTYYVTVTACNAADLCTSTSSDGVVVDDSPPVAGRVLDGHPGAGGVSFQSSRLQLSAHWWGFHDPHSGLSHYEWRAGTAPGADDVLSTTRAEKTQELALLFLPETHQMPEDRDVFVTVRAFNRIGLWTEAWSDGFRVDTTPPDVVAAPAVDTTLGIGVQNTQVMRDLVRLHWTFEDSESGIKDQYISVSTHHNGDVKILPIKISGGERDHSYTNLTLDEGSQYYATVVACNFAGLCTEAQAEPLLVDGSPPSVGEFISGEDDQPDPGSTATPPAMTSTSSLPHYHTGWMTWREDTATSTGSLALAWRGFADVHSGISHYFVSVGSTYSGQELTSSGPVKVDHANDSSLSPDEDVTQTAVVPLEGSILALKHPYLYISIWAVNMVGIPSQRHHSTFEAAATSADEGALVPLESCTAATCEGHCACAHRSCETTPDVCSDVTDSNPNMEIEVLDVLGLTCSDGCTFIDKAYTPTQFMMAGVWRITQLKGLSIQWYECSIGDESSTPTEPAGVFDPAMEKVWTDVGRDNHTAITLDRKLTKGVKYYIFVRAWYDPNTFAVFRSDGITPDITPPKIYKMKGVKIKDLARADATKDTDYLTAPGEVFISWDRVFLDFAISHYQVSLSTYPGGEDVSQFADHTLPASTVSIHMTGLTLQSGRRYYSNVRAFNEAGLHTLRSSDGFVVDMRKPDSGQVYDGLELHDVEYQNSSKVVSASWYGFVDLESYIDHYVWCVGRTLDPAEDSILPCTDVGVRLSASKMLDTPLVAGIRYYSKVTAVDAAGIQSTPVLSDGFILDITPPEPQEHVLLGDNVIVNPSFEGVAGAGNALSPWEVGPGIQSAVPGEGGARDGNLYLSLHGSVSQTVSGTRTGGHYLIAFFASHAVPSQDPLVNQEGRVEAPGLNRVFRLYDRPTHGQPDQSPGLKTWQEHRFYFTAVGDSSTLTISSVGQTNGILLDLVQVRPITIGPSTGDGSVQVDTQFVRDWSSIQAKWHFTDPESPIVDYTWAVGTTKGGTQVRGFKSVGTQTSDSDASLHMQHGVTVYVTVTSRNAADLIAVAISHPVLVDLTPPVIEYVIDGRNEYDIDFSPDDRSVSFSYSASDPETGIDFCEWKVGSEPGKDDVLPTTKTSESASRITQTLTQPAVEGQRLYATVTCYNRAKQPTLGSSDGVTVLTAPPASSAAAVRVLALSATQYGTRDGYQSQRDTLRGAWSGFYDAYGISYYECHLSGPGSFEVPWTTCGSTSETHFNWSGLGLAGDAGYTLSVRAINHAGLTSPAVTQRFDVESSEPTVADIGALTQSWSGNGTLTVQLSWDGLFATPSSILVYEVSLGSVPGGTDVLQWIETTESQMRVSPLVPFTDYHLTLTAVNAAGLSRTVTKLINDT